VILYFNEDNRNVLIS